MVKEWATVVRWQKGRALLRYGSSSGCDSCQANAACGSYLLEKLGPENIHQLELEISQPLQPGQKVEVGIPESSLLRSAMLVYLTPLLGLFLGGLLFQYWVTDQLWVVMGGVIGGVTGFFFARKIAKYWDNQQAYQPVVLQIGLPPDTIKVLQQE
ncbi:SoxR-reducing system protein RseC [Xenorhabdus bovienii]|uniref:SoxR-reducing system protein RseC n=1 Tax=Xenorhabdus bovienii TaxID=40576 RepID=UPI0023B214E5|nr:SoxR-reducing system protein RseC [Xenorhabdus bovienii]MDE9494157.1 SoxR-reducing system protein RseC [Xenorhabdus bovienii]MDE9502694.1 SoxR-reducing system protein RseC [Xenorhabdus bovienii]MDE9518686.1 SoxR-reducing system protein RseC [Xenorhabdus bovienii]MDE9527735.1 SoxR-reducing system protein RseC [Xenorhabdus bovienii]MDE9570952.1 SoxR-reducing system protein RseC [Xenorhabdus bovienii]